MIRNFTPHVVTFVSTIRAPRIHSSEGVARVSVKEEMDGDFCGEIVYTERFAEVTGLPARCHDVVILVSRMVRDALPERGDLATPVGLVRDSEGKIIGCKGLAFNPASDFPVCLCGRFGVRDCGSSSYCG